MEKCTEAQKIKRWENQILHVNKNGKNDITYSVIQLVALNVFLSQYLDFAVFVKSFVVFKLQKGGKRK